MRYRSSISLALIVLMALACSAPPPANTPNIDATVEARLAEEKTAEPPTPTPFKHHPLLSPEQVYKILEQYISNTVKKEELGSRAFDCLYWYHGPFFYSVLDGDGHERSVIEWSYMDDNSDRWILTTVGDQCDGIQKWYFDDDTGKLLQEPKFQEHQLATPAP